MRTILAVTQHGAALPMARMTSTAEASRTLLLAPSTMLSSPRGWSAVSTMPSLTGKYEEVHCTGGGSLLLFLLCAAGKAPRLLPHGRVHFHGEVVLPTSESCAAWLKHSGAKNDILDDYEWRQAAVSLGVGGNLRAHHHWLEPIARSIVTGRTCDLVEQFEDLRRRSERKGRLVHLNGAKTPGATALQELCAQTDTCRIEDLRLP